MFDLYSIIGTSLGLALIVMVIYLILMKMLYSWKKAAAVLIVCVSIFAIYSNMESPPDIKELMIETSEAMGSRYSDLVERFKN